MKLYINRDCFSSAWKNYDTYCASSTDDNLSYVKKWHRILTHCYQAIITEEHEERILIMPDDYYALFLLKWS